jgi:cytoskeletal protein RodZ
MAKGNFGERLKRERELREVSLSEITAGTRIGPRFLEALENEQWEKLPGGVFNRGFVRAIAHFLGLDEENLLAEYDLAHGEQKIQAPAPYENRLPSRPLWVSAVSILVILALLSGLFYAGRYGWRLFHAYRARKYSSAVQSATVGATTPMLIPAAQTPTRSDPPRPANSSSSASALTLTLSTSAATRVRILADNKVLLDAEIQAGENRRFLANDQFEVTAADSSAVLLDLNGRTMPPLGMPGASGTIVLSRKNLR